MFNMAHVHAESMPMVMSKFDVWCSSGEPPEDDTETAKVQHLHSW